MKMNEMPDRERVIARLEEAMLLSEIANECKVTLGYGIVEDVLALLKAQEPVEPVIDKTTSFWTLWRCGACGTTLIATDMFCGKCGMAVKWE